MRALDWAIVAIYLVWMLWDGLRRTKKADQLEGYFLGGRSLPWWVVGLSVMATQLSAITLIGTTGQGATDGLRFVQFYFGLPVAMVILGVTLVPFLHRAKVYTAYEYLERRFDVRTRTLASFLFLMGRAFSLGCRQALAGGFDHVTHPPAPPWRTAAQSTCPATPRCLPATSLHACPTMPPWPSRPACWRR